MGRGAAGGWGGEGGVQPAAGVGREGCGRVRRCGVGWRGERGAGVARGGVRAFFAFALRCGVLWRGRRGEVSRRCVCDDVSFIFGNNIDRRGTI